jgi:hypothetical protein
MRPILLFLSAFAMLVACDQKQPDAALLLDAVPLKSAAVVQFQSLPTSLERLGQTAVGELLDSLDHIHNWSQLLTALQPLTRDTSNSNRMLPGFACVHLSGGQKFEILWLVPEVLVAKFKDFPGYSLQRTREYGGAKIHVFLAPNGKSFAVARIKQVLALSTSEILVEEAIKQMEAPIKITNDPYFAKAYASINKRDYLNVLINFADLPEFAKWGMPQTGHDWLRQFSRWGALDVDLKYDQVLLNGITLFNDSVHDYLATFRKNSPHSFDAPEIFPVQTAAFVALSAENFPQHQRAYLDFLSYHNKSSAYKRHQTDFGFDAAGLLATHIKNEWGIFYPESKSADVFGNKFGYFESNNITKTQEAITNIPGTQLLETYREVDIYRFGAPSFLPHTLGQLFWGLNDVYVVFWKDYVVFASAFGQLKGLINDWQDGKTLDQDPTFKAFAKEFSSKGHVWAVAAQPAGLNYAPALFSAKIAKNIQKQTQTLATIKYIGLHIRATDQAGITTIIAKHETQAAPDTRRRWTTQLQAPVAMQPIFVTNHNNGLQEIFVQDSAHNVYLIDGTGQILWQRAVSGKILGTATQVDLFKNNKLQLAFNTATHFYIIDRNGADVRPFPLVLPEAATAGVGVFDYDNTKNYRFILPVGKKLLNYGADGLPVAGWESPALATSVMQTPQHIRVGEADYILAITRGGQIRLLNRKGEDRVTVPGTFPLAQKELFLFQGQSPEEARLVGLTETGKLINVFFNGKADSLDAGLGSAVYLYMQGDKYLLAGKRKLQLREPNQPFEVTTPADISIGPFLFADGDNQYCGAGAVAAQQIWLYGLDGKMLPGFPVFGNTAFTIGSFRPGEPTSIVVGTPDGNMVCYRLQGQ